MLRKKKYQSRFTQIIKNRYLVAWLRKQGAPDYASTFVLEKGMGQKVNLTIVNDEMVQMDIYGASHEMDGKMR